MSDAELEQKLKWHSKQLQKGMIYVIVKSHYEQDIFVIT